MVNEEIRKLSMQYSAVLEKYRKAEKENAACTVKLEKEILKEIKDYLYEILSVLPVSVNAWLDGYYVHFCKGIKYDTVEGLYGKTMDAVIIRDTKSRGPCMVFDNALKGLYFKEMENPSIPIPAGLLETICINWGTWKKSLDGSITGHLNHCIKLMESHTETAERRNGSIKGWEV